MKKFLKLKVWKTELDIIQSVAILILIIIILWSSFLNPLASYKERLNETEEGLKRAERRNMILEFDRVRLEDTGNILLAIQDYYFQKNTFPESLDNLRKGAYLDPNSRLIDPSTNQPYFYQKREQDFVLCIYLSDMLKGVNTTSCPSADSKKSSAAEQNILPEKQEANTGKVEIVADGVINVRAKSNTSS